MTTRILGSACSLFALVLAACSDPASPAGQGGQGSGGQAGTGGSGGSGPVVGCPSVPDDLISDFKTDNSIAAADGRQGGWYVYGDDVAGSMYSPPKTAPFPIDAANGNTSCSGAGSLHLKATGFSQWGAALGTDFKPTVTGMPKPTYDATKYKGIAFWAKGAAAIKHVQVKFLDINQDPAAALVPADACIYTAGSAYNCSPYVVVFGAEGDAAPFFTKYATSQIDTTWKRFEVLFADAHQDPGNPGFKTPPADKLDVAHMTGIAVQVNANYDAQGKASANDFEIWLDDVEFIK
jgi:hypothetical protein